MKKILIASIVLFMGLTSTGFADEHITTTTSHDHSAMKMKIENRVANLSGEQIDIVLVRIDAFRSAMDASSLSAHKIASYNMILDTLEEVLKEMKMVMNGETMVDELPTIVETAVSVEDFSTLVTALQAGNLVDTLSGEGPFTVFAPDNAAFDKVDSETLAMLLEEENIAMLQEILTYHVVSGTYLASDVTDGLTLETVNGAELTFTLVDGKVMIDGDTSVTLADVAASNGVIHKIDMVLMPKEKEMLTIAEAAMMKDEFSTLVVALKAADLAETLMGEGPFTVFAPDNAAFDKVDSETLAMLLEEENMEMLQEILTYHVVSGSYMVSDITDGLMLETVNGAELTFTIADGMVMIDGNTTVTMADMVKSNGVVHKIDMVLMP